MTAPDLRDQKTQLPTAAPASEAATEAATAAAAAAAPQGPTRAASPGVDLGLRLRVLVLCVVTLAAGLGLLHWSFSRGDPLTTAATAARRHRHGHGTRGERIIQLARLPRRHVPDADPRGDGHGKRLVIVGDVHGCRADLEHLLSKVHFDEQHDHLVLAGDMINKGPDSHGVLALARHVGASCVRGNHEDNLLKSHFAPHIFPPNRRLRQLDRTFGRADIEFLAGCPLILELGDVPGLDARQAVVVHGGLVPGVRLEDQDPFDVMHMRTISRHMRPSEERDGTPWWRVWHREQKRLPKRQRTAVIYGHDARSGLVEQKYSVGLDTGCVRGGRLTALVLGGKHERELVSVHCKPFED